MKNMLKLILAIVLCLALAGSACAELSLTLIADLPGGSDWVTDSNVYYTRYDTGYALFDADGNQITDAIYDFNTSTAGYIPTLNLTADRANNGGNGLMNTQGEEIIPYSYGYVDVLNAHWAMACTLTPASEEDRDLTVIVFGGDTEYYNFATVDLYNLDARKLMATIPGEEFLGAEAIGSCINVGNALTNSGATYDANYQMIGDGISSLYDDRHVPAEALDGDPVPESFYKEGLYGLRDAAGNVIKEPAYKYVYGYYGGYARIQMGEDGSERSGLINLQGELVVPAEYDNFRIYNQANIDRQESFVTDGYIGAEKDGKLVFLNDQGQVTCETEYLMDDVTFNGTSAVLTDRENKTAVIIAADGVITTIENCESISHRAYSNGKYYSARINDETVLLDWHGEALLSGTKDANDPSHYYSFDFSRDMSRIIVDTREGYKLFSTGL